MANFKWYNGNQGMFRYWRFSDFEITNQDLNGATLLYDSGNGAFDETRYPWRIEFSFSGAVEHTFEEGPDAGDTIFTEGKLTTVSYYNLAGDLILEVSDANVDLALISAWLVQGDVNFNNLWDLIAQDDGVYRGSADGSGPSQDWDGDSIRTGYGNDVVNARGGDDFISDLFGKDKYNGGNGWDILDYSESFWNAWLVKRGIKVDLSENKITGYDGKVDTVRNIEEVRGTFKKDYFVGDGEGNKFFGFQGKDVFNGKGGFDVVSYRRDVDYGGTDGIKAKLNDGFVRDGFGHRDKLKSIEGVEGTEFNDVFVDNGKNNWFRLRDGDDTVTLSLGNDYVDARGTGADTFIFRTNRFGNDEIDGFDDGQGDRIQIVNAANMGDLNIYQDGDDAMIEFGSNSVRLFDFDSNDLGAGDFIFV